MKNIAEQVEDLAGRIEQYRVALADGNLEIDVKALQPDLEGMLKQMHTLDPAEGKQYLPQLEQLVRGISELTSDYQRLQGELAREAKRVDNATRANTAYANPWLPRPMPHAG